MFNNYLNTFISIGKKSVGFILFVICSYAIYRTVLKNENWTQLGILLKTQLLAIQFYQWVILLVLMGFNFLIESIKWKVVVADMHPISFTKAVKSVMVGQAFAFFTPNRIGDFAGRVLFLKTEHKLIGMAHLAWASYAQLIITLLLGTIAININMPLYPWINGVGLSLIKMGSPFIGLILMLLFFYKKEWKGKLSFLNVIQIKTRVKATLLLLSLLRYLIFLLQYIWVAYLLKIQIDNALLVVSISILFLCLSILPTINITELVVRGQLLILILAPFYADKHMIVFLSSLIWGVNFLIPAVIGSFLLLGYRLNR
jgi:hypothetical protein